MRIAYLEKKIRESGAEINLWLLVSFLIGLSCEWWKKWRFTSFFELIFQNVKNSDNFRKILGVRKKGEKLSGAPGFTIILGQKTSNTDAAKFVAKVSLKKIFFFSNFFFKKQNESNYGQNFRPSYQGDVFYQYTLFPILVFSNEEKNNNLQTSKNRIKGSKWPEIPILLRFFSNFQL